MWANFREIIVDFLRFLSGKTVRNVASQVNEIKAGQGILKANLNELRVNLNELRVNLDGLKVELDADQRELKTGQGELKAGQETMVDAVCRGLVMIINRQNQVLERLDDIEANIKEIKREKKN